MSILSLIRDNTDKVIPILVWMLFNGRPYTDLIIDF